MEKASMVCCQEVCLSNNVDLQNNIGKSMANTRVFKIFWHVLIKALHLLKNYN